MDYAQTRPGFHQSKHHILNRPLARAVQF